MIPILTPISATLANALAAAIWQGILLAAIVALSLRLLPAITAAARSIVWTAVFAIVLLLHFLPFIGTSVARASGASSIHVASAWSLALAAVWIALFLFRATQFCLSALALRRIGRNATPVSAQQTPRRYTLCTSPDVDRPSVIGFFRPRILLPPDLFASLSADDLHQVLLHETEHLRRRDDWTNLLQKLALVLFPLNPALLWVERRLCLERELACDDRVLLTTGARKAYATCLTSLAEHTLVRRGISLALAAFTRQSELTRRVHRILRAPQQAISSGQSAALAAALILALTTGSVALTHAPQLITFSPARSSEPVTHASQSHRDEWVSTPKAVLASFPTKLQSVPRSESRFVPHSSQLHRDEWVASRRSFWQPNDMLTGPPIHQAPSQTSVPWSKSPLTKNPASSLPPPPATEFLTLSYRQSFASLHTPQSQRSTAGSSSNSNHPKPTAKTTPRRARHASIN